jgi:uncharacterized membrane protein YeaQ/YmgE (transglycosylase-associated protein family)
VEVFLLIALIISGTIFGCLGSWIASQKKRDQGEGFALGCLFGPFGALIEALLPAMSESQRPEGMIPVIITPEEVERITPEEVERVRKENAELEAKREANRAALEEFRRKRNQEERARFEAEARLRREAEERRAREEEERARLRRQRRDARWAKIQATPEWTKVVIGVVVMVVVIAAVFATVVRLVPKN